MLFRGCEYQQQPEDSLSKGQDAHGGAGGAQLRDIVPLQQAAAQAGEHLRRGTGESVEGQVQGPLVPGEAVQGIRVQMFKDWRPRGPGSRKGGERERRAHSGHPRELASGARHLGGPRGGELPDWRDERSEDSVL